MTTAPKSPGEHRSFADGGATGVDDAVASDHRDGETGVQSGQPGDAGVNPDEPAVYGNLKQNLTTHWKVQER